MMKQYGRLAIVPILAGSLFWGEHGHAISGRAAGTDLPQAMPAFFRGATAQFEYLNPEPDRWRVRQLTVLDDAFEFDHYVNLERLPPGALDADDRFAYIAVLRAAGIRNPERVGLLPFRIIELYERLLTEFKLWRAEPTDSPRRRFIEQRILNDAGVLGHYVTDAANPHHTTIHHNGWADGAANPNNFTMDRTFHSRFESQFVGARIGVNDILSTMDRPPRLLTDVRADVLAHVQQSHGRLEALYRTDQAAPFNARTVALRNKEFAVERLVAGVEMLRSLWWTAWVRSEEAPARAGGGGAGSG